MIGIRESALLIRGREYQLGSRTHVMAIINVTTDSFSGDGLSGDLDKVRDRIRHVVDQGADLIDVGGESTRPGAIPVSVNDELARVLPVIEMCRQETDLPISIDTYKSPVAREALNAGADLVNDVWSFQSDPAMGSLVAETGCPVVLMHNRQAKATQSEIGAHYDEVNYEDVVDTVRVELIRSIRIAEGMGIDEGQIIIDPGIGFGKTPEQNLELLFRLSELKSLGYPLLLGASRKSVVAHAMASNNSGISIMDAHTVGGTCAANAMGILSGANMIRVHDVAQGVAVARVTDSIMNVSGS
tara:strand:- start:4767 stop:5666 length:900 start_codon:yes stop_codon:yes gene_type:complete